MSKGERFLYLLLQRLCARQQPSMYKITVEFLIESYIINRWLLQKLSMSTVKLINAAAVKTQKPFAH